jgi:hypothetical protein
MLHNRYRNSHQNPSNNPQPTTKISHSPPRFLSNFPSHFVEQYFYATINFSFIRMRRTDGEVFSAVINLFIDRLVEKRIWNCLLIFLLKKLLFEWFSTQFLLSKRRGKGSCEWRENINGVCGTWFGEQFCVGFEALREQDFSIFPYKYCLRVLHFIG